MAKIKRNKVDFNDLIIGATAAALFEGAFEVAKKKFPQLQGGKVQLIKAGSAAGLGLAIAFLSKSKNAQSIGLGLLSVAASTGVRQIIYENVNANDPVNGTNRVLPANSSLQQKIKQARAARRLSNGALNSTNSIVPMAAPQELLYLA